MADSSTHCSVENKPPLSPPKCEVDETPIHHQISKNKESLKVKLMLRRPINQLVDQGILPSPKTPPSFFVQKQKLERAKMGDLLKAKIQKRPGRQELIQQHILEDTGNVDPSLAERQRQLKKAKLADSLNDQLSHRPGPLELIKGNILHTDQELERAVKEGQILFKKTSEGETRKNPPRSFVPQDPSEEDSTSDGTVSPLQDLNFISPSPTSSSVSQFPTLTSSVASNMGSASSLNSISPISSPPSLTNFTKLPSLVSIPQPMSSVPVSMSPQIPCALSISQLLPQNSPKCDAPGKDSVKNRKKSKPKTQAKTRTIKFHEYKGPPSAQKSQVPTSSSVESSYELLLKQQQLLLQMQLEWQHKYPQILLPANKSCDQGPTGVSTLIAVTPKLSAKGNLQPAALSSVNDGSRCLAKLEDMKVSDLKAELKKRNLPVSGSKPQLIERLRPYSDVTTSAATGSVQLLSTTLSNSGSTALTTVNVGPIVLDSSCSPVTIDESADKVLVSSDTLMDTLAVSPSSGPNSVAPMDVESENDSTMDTSDYIAPNSNDRKMSLSSLPGVPEPPPPPPMPPSKLFSPSTFNNKVNESISGLPSLVPCTSFEQESHQPPLSPADLSSNILTRQEHQIEDIVKNLQLPQQNTHTLEQHIRDRNQSIRHSVPDQKIQKLILQQHLQNKLQQNKLQMQLLELHNLQNNKVNPNHRPANYILTAGSKAELAALVQACSSGANNNQSENCQTKRSSLNEQSNPSLLLNQVKQPPNGLMSSRGSTLPSFTVLTQQVGGQPQVKVVGCSDATPESLDAFGMKPPPNYDEATRQLKGKKIMFGEDSCPIASNCTTSTAKKASVKSQAVEDVLEILIRNGELPPSAAQEPTTPKQGPTSLMFPQIPSTGVLTNNKLVSKQSTVPTPPPLPVWSMCDNNVSSKEHESINCSNSHVVDNHGMSYGSCQGKSSIYLPDTEFLNNNVCQIIKTETPDLSDLTLDFSSLEDGSDMNHLDNGLKLEADSVLFSVPNNNAVSSMNNWGNVMEIDDDLFNSLSSSFHSDNYECVEMSKDPLLTCSQEPLDFFNLEDLEMKSFLNPWDKLDLPT